MASPPLTRRHDALAAAATLTAARRVLVTGFHGLSAPVMVAICDLAEALGAAIDAGDADLSRPTGPTIARAGEVTADCEELRDRADLVIFWFCDPSLNDPQFIERFVTVPLSRPRRRRTLSVGPLIAMPVGTDHTQLRLGRGDAVAAARVIRHMLLHGPHAPGETAIASTCAAAVDAIEAASCVAIVTDHATDALGLEPWSVVHLVRTIAHRKPAFEVPIESPTAAAARAVLTWRYGAGGAIAKADRSGGPFLPGEASAAALIERGDVDCVLAVGGLAQSVERALAAHEGGITVIRIDGNNEEETAFRIGSILAAIRDSQTGSGGDR